MKIEIYVVQKLLIVLNDPRSNGEWILTESLF